MRNKKLHCHTIRTGILKKIPDVIAPDQGKAWLRSDITNIIPLP
jgi:hypothetical protein